MAEMMSAAQGENLDPEERYRYIGFDVYGKKAGGFWRDDNEKKSYIEQVKQEIGSIYRNSVVYADVINKTDRLAITIGSFLMVLAPFLPWVKAHTLYGSASYIGIFGIFQMGGFWFYVSKMGGSVVPLSIYLMTLLAYVSLAFGVLTLASVYRKAASEEAYSKRLKKMLKLNMIPCLAFLLILVLSLIGQRIPFGASLGIEEITGSYNVVTLIQLSHVGMWLAVFGALMNFNKSKEI